MQQPQRIYSNTEFHLTHEHATNYTLHTHYQTKWFQFIFKLQLTANSFFSELPLLLLLFHYECAKNIIPNQQQKNKKQKKENSQQCFQSTLARSFSEETHAFQFQKKFFMFAEKKKYLWHNNINTHINQSVTESNEWTEKKK